MPGILTRTMKLLGKHELSRAKAVRRRKQRSLLLETLEGRRLFVGDTYKLQLLHASDMEAGLDAVQDAPNFAAIVDFFDDTVPNTLILASGDTYIPGTFFNAGGDPALNALLGSASVGRADIEILNRIGIEASAFGNHEFDAGTREVRNIIAASSPWRGAQYPYLSANLNFSTDANFTGLISTGGLEASTIKGRVAPSAIITEGGQKIGLVGVTTPMLASISSPGSVGISPANASDIPALAAAVQPTIDALIAAGANKIIVMSHLQQISFEQALAPLLRGVDIIMGGGSNTLLADGTDRLRAGDTADGNYPLSFTNADGDAGLIVNTDGNYKYVGRLVIEFDAAGKLLPLSYVASESGAYATDNQGVQDLWGNLTAPFAAGTKGAAVAEVTAAIAGVISSKDGQRFGRTDVYLNGLRAEVRTEETNLGNLTADANLATGRQTDATVAISIKNGGGIRDSIGSTVDVLDANGNVVAVNRVTTIANPSTGKNAGDVSKLDVENSLRFNNSLSLITVTAANLKRILEHGVAATTATATPGQFPQIGGIAFSFDRTQTAQVLTGSTATGIATVTTEGSRVRNVARIGADGEVLEKIVENGSVVGDPNRLFRVVTLGFLIDDGDSNGLGGDNYPFPTFGSNRVNLTGGEQLALSDYLEAEFPLTGAAFKKADTPVALDKRIQNRLVRTDTIFTNTAPTGVALQNAVITLPENTSTVPAFKVADIVVNDDIFGTNNLSLSGADAASFQIFGSELRLKPGTVLDFEARTSFSITVQVDDPSVGSTPDASTNFRLSISNVADGNAPHASNALVVVPTGTFTAGNSGAAEIVAHDPATQRLFSLNGPNNRLDVVNISNPANPIALTPISLAAYGAAPNSVAMKNGIIAVAMEASLKTDLGKVVFFSTEGVFLKQVTVGAQPDSLTFTPDGSKVLVANEGEPNVGDTINPDGSVTIINLTTGGVIDVASATVTTASFTAFNGREAELRGRGVRITAGKSFSVDAEPEFIAVSPDGLTARVTLQENNAFAVVNLTTNIITEIQALGLKDYNTGTPVITTYDFDDATLPVIGTTATGQDLKLGGFSGLHFEGTDPVTGNLKFIANTDRGPNGEPSNVLPLVPGNERAFALPDFVPELVRFELNQTTGRISITSRIPLTRTDGTPLTGLPNLQAGAQGTAYTDEVAVDLNGVQIPNDPFGADLEGVVIAPDGSFWLPDEYRPAIYHFDSTGKLIDRFIPQGTAAAGSQPAGTFGTEALPAVYGQFRRANRGFEAIALEGNKIYAFIQTNLDNPSGSAAVRNNGVIRVLEFDITTKAVTGEFLYVMRDTTAVGTAKTDKIGDAVALGGGRFLVVERDDRTTTESNKLIYEINLKGATNVLGTALATATSGTTLESLTPAGLATNSVRPVDKRLVVNAAAIGYTGVGKLEGLAVVDSDTIALLNDNDFQLAGTIAVNGSAPLNPTPEPIRLGLIDFSGSNGLDASDRDLTSSTGRISINRQPVFGMFMPDSVAAYSVGGRNYFVTANEGDDRDDFITPDETSRAGASGYVLDPTVFPNAAALKNNAVLGRLTVSTFDGNLDGVGGFERIHAYGARSFSIWDAAGNRVFDSGDALEQITAAQVPSLFNSDGAAGSFDTRSDNKGPEPEGVTIGEIAERTYAFVGLERVGGFITFDITDPRTPQFVNYTNPAANATGTLGRNDRAPEGIIFVSAANSPRGNPLVIIGNEVSGTATIYTVNVPGSPPVFSSAPTVSVSEANTLGVTGPSSSATPYLTSTNAEVQFTSIFTVGDAVNGYRMVGIPDGLGAYDNNDGTFTLLMNHELGATAGIARAHGQTGAFVSRWIISKSTLQVIDVQDFLSTGTSVYLSDNVPGSSGHGAFLAAATTAFNRLCSADLAPVSAYQWTDPATGTTFGTSARIFQSGEESGQIGRQFAFVATDDSNTTLNETRTAWELPHFGLLAWENSVASPVAQRKTIVAGLDDGTGGQLYFWVGDKQNTGNVVERAGLTKKGANDNLYAVRVRGLNDTVSAALDGAFTLANLGDVSGLTGVQLESNSNAAGAAQFLRPEDGQWDPSNPRDFYFVTTNKYDQTKDGTGSQVGRSRLYRLRFTDITNPQAGGTITAVLDGTEAGNMFDNMTIDRNGKIIIQEDVGNQQHLGKVWSYVIATDTLTEVGQHDRARFGDVGVPAVSPFNQDEESSGVIDVSDILGPGTFLLDVQAHYAIPGELVEGGQLLLMRNNVVSGQPLVTTLTASDADNTVLTFAISGGADAADFTIDPLTGRLSFVVAPSFETPADADTNNVYLVNVSVSDGINAAVVQSLQVTVTAVNESPTNTTVAAVSVSENATAITTVTGVDPEGVPLVFTISGGADATRFTMNQTSGALSFVTAPNFEAPTDNGLNNSYFVTVTVSDGINPPVKKTVAVTVSDVNENPLPVLRSVAVNTNDSFSNARQRSQITSLLVTLSAPIVDFANAFSITNLGLFAAQTPTSVTNLQVSDRGNGVYEIRFGMNGAGVVNRQGTGALGNSLADGNYLLTVDPNKVSGDNQFGEKATDEFFRMFGDSDGDGDVDGTDTFAFRQAQRPGLFNAALDANGDSFVNSSDTSSFVNGGKRRRLF